MKVLVIDCCIRGEKSRTMRLLWECMRLLEKREEASVTLLSLPSLDLNYLNGAFFEEREALLLEGALDAGRFGYAHQFAEADRIVIAAPLWDLSFPALLKIYIENVSVDGITFTCDANGMHGKCRAKRLLFLTTRGGFYENTEAEQGCRYLKAFGEMCGIHAFHSVAAEGLDYLPEQADRLVDEACKRIPEAVEWLLKE